MTSGNFVNEKEKNHSFLYCRNLNYSKSRGELKLHNRIEN